MTNVLVTGAAGFIGRALVTELTGSGYRVVAFDKKRWDCGARSIRADISTFDFGEVVSDIDGVFHLAGMLGTAELFHRTIEAERVNVLGTLNLLESMRKSDLDKIVFASKPTVWKHNVYTITKENCERYLEMYREVYGFHTVIARPFNVYGPGQYLLEYRKAIPYFIVSALRNEPLEIFGDGEQTVDAVHVYDVATALRMCYEKLPREAVDIGTAEPTSVRQLAQEIIRLTKSKSEIVNRPSRKGESRNSSRICANGNIETLLEFKPQIRLEDGLKSTIKWYQEHLDDFTRIYVPSEDEFW